MKDRDDEELQNWEALKVEFVKRFPRPEKRASSKTKDALQALFELKQKGRNL